MASCFPVPAADNECHLANLYAWTFYTWAKWVFIYANGANGSPGTAFGDNEIAIRTIVQFENRFCQLPSLITYVHDYGAALQLLDMEAYGTFALDLVCAARSAITSVTEMLDVPTFAAGLTTAGYPELAALATTIKPSEWNRGGNYFLYSMGDPYPFTGLFWTDCEDCT